MSCAFQIKINGTFAGNLLRFASEAEAKDAALFFAQHWPWRRSADVPIPHAQVMSSGDDPVTHIFVDGKLGLALASNGRTKNS